MIYNAGRSSRSLAAKQGLRRRSVRLRHCRLSGFIVPAVLAVCTHTALARDPVPTEPSIVEVQQALGAGRFDVRTLERHYETRINAIDRQGPKLNAVIETNPSAATLARELDSAGSQKRPS